MVRALFDPQHPRGNRYRRTPPPEGKAPCCSSCEMYLLCQHGCTPLEIVRDPSYGVDALAGESELDANLRRPGTLLYHKVRVRPKQVHKIPAIKEYREETGASLKDAKDHVEAQFDLAVKWYELSDDCPRFGPKSSFWDEEGTLS